jgi:hypothetical protein
VPCKVKQSPLVSDTVVSVLDGDTIKVLHNSRPERIHVSGIDCPEKGQAYGKRVKGFAGIAWVVGPSRPRTWSSRPLRQRRLRETTMGAAQKISTDFLTTSLFQDSIKLMFLA